MSCTVYVHVSYLVPVSAVLHYNVLSLVVLWPQSLHPCTGRIVTDSGCAACRRVERKRIIKNTDVVLIPGTWWLIVLAVMIVTHNRSNSRYHIPGSSCQEQVTRSDLSFINTELY